MPHSSADQGSDRNALILYGSETGAAQDVADELGRVAERLHFLSQVADADSVPVETWSAYSIVLIAISTTGQGGLPANARATWRRLLRKKLPATHLNVVNLAVFGLGDSSYPKFNWAARKLHKRVLQLGACGLCPLGEADEQHSEGTDGALIPWIAILREKLLERFPLPHGLDVIPDHVLLPPKWILATSGVSDTANGKTITSCRRLSFDGDTLNLPPTDLLPIPNAITVTLDQNERVTPSQHWQDVRQLSFSAATPVEYGPGDVLTIFPKNFPGDVGDFIALMDWQDVADLPLKFQPMKAKCPTTTYPPPPIPNLIASPTTIRKLLTHHLDITAIPRRSFFALIAHFTDDEMQQERLREFTDPQYTDELYDYTTRPRRSVLEVLQEFTTVRIPWQWVASILPALRGRQFSIASGGMLKHIDDGSPDSVGRAKFELLVAIVRYRTVIRKIRQGVCTRYLSTLPTGTRLNVTLSRGGLNVSKKEASRPVVMIAPGTGVAPMRSMLWERLAWQNEGESQLPLGKSVLFFGCRNRDADYFFQREWKTLKERLDLDVFVATSRDQRTKIYVQDLVRKEAKLIHRLLQEEDGIVYICGSSGKMPSAVREALIEVFQQEGRIDRQAAEMYLAGMEKDGRYKQETW